MAVKSSNQITLVDLTDGYSVIFSNESHVFLGDTTGVSGTQKVTCTVQALQGDEQVTCSVPAITGLPTPLTIVSDGKTPSPTLTITATSALKTSGTVMIPVSIGEISISKSFSYSIALKGTTGTAGTSVTVTSTKVEYQVSTNGTTAPNGTWSTSVPSVPVGQYLWTRTGVTYSDGKSTTAYSVSRNGTDGTDGADALVLVITSSNGTIFKNTDVATTLTASVYKGGVAVTGTTLAAIGTVKWYKDGASKSMATGETLTIQAGDVLSRASYTAQLEG